MPYVGSDGPTGTDLFAGAGGTTTGAEDAGLKIIQAANHWPLAVEVHNENHPHADHDCADISQVDPRRYRRTDFLLGSPECTFHSPAAGRRRVVGQEALPLDEKPLPAEAGERSRATMWDMPRFAEVHQYPIVIVENVVEVTKWPPFRAWLMAMDSIGYQHEVVCHNSMHAQYLGLPAPQSRDRVYIVFWRRGMRKPDLDRIQRPQAWCPRCEKIVEAQKAWKPTSAAERIGKYRQQYVYIHGGTCGQTVEPGWLPASAAIDWTLPAQRICDRARPLSPKTMARIREGLRRHGHEILALDALHGAGQYAPVRIEPLRTQTTAFTRSLLVPVEGRDGKQAAPDTLPMRTTTTRNELGIVTMLRGHNAPKTTDQAIDTVAAGGNHHALLMPYYGANVTAVPSSDPIGTITTTDRYGLIMRNNTGLGEMVTPAREPFRTVTGGAQQSLLEPVTIEPDDCYFRMFEPIEYAAGMAFPNRYIWRGTKRERVKLAGNAVTPPVERDIVSVCIESLG